MKRLLVAMMLLGMVSAASGQDFDANSIMLELQKQVLAPVATSCVEMKIFDSKDLRRKLVFRRGYFYGPSGGGIKEKIFIDFVFPPELSRMKYFLVEDENGNREKELLWTESQRRTRRITNANQAFMQASDYLLYDLLDHINEPGWEYFPVNKEVITKKQGLKEIKKIFFTIEAKFNGAAKAYGRLIIKVEEIAPNVFVYSQIDFYDDQNNLLKKEYYFDFENIWDIYYRPKSMRMESPSRKTRTELRFRWWQVRLIKKEDNFIFQDSYLGLEKDFPSQCSEKDFE